MAYVIYGIMSFFFLYEIILLAEDFSGIRAVKELHREFKTTACGQCIPGMFVFLTYVLGVPWLDVFCFSVVPCLCSIVCGQLVKSLCHPDQRESQCGAADLHGYWQCGKSFLGMLPQEKYVAVP